MSRESVTAVVALGANLGEPAQAVRQALDALSRLPGTTVTARSGLWRTAPFEASGPDYINAVAVLSTGLCAPALLAALQALEQAAGRERPFHHAPRTLDLDLLFYGEGSIASPALTVPHPRWRERAFVLAPLAEVMPQRVTESMRRAVAGQAIERL